MRRVLAVLLVLLSLSLPAAADPAQDKARAYFTDTPLVDQRGQTVRFYSDVLKDKVVLVSFLYTRCTSACPLLMDKLRRVRAELGEQAAEVEFVSLSVDPQFDTPAALARFAKQHRAQGPGWTFLTGAPEDVKQVQIKLGQYVPEAEAHSTALLAGNERRRHWMKVRPDESPQAVAARLKELLAGPGTAQR